MAVVRLLETREGICMSSALQTMNKLKQWNGCGVLRNAGTVGCTYGIGAVSIIYVRKPTTGGRGGYLSCLSRSRHHNLQRSHLGTLFLTMISQSSFE